MEDQKTTIYNDLKNKHIFITGGATGIGAEMVRAFSQQGAVVSFIDKDVASATVLCEEVDASGGERPWFKNVDVTKVSTLEGAIESAVKDLGPVYALINNVANDTRYSPEEINEDSWRNSLAVNLDPAFFASKAAYPSMKQNNKGSIINFSSINALLGPANMPAYVTAKAGLIGMTKALANDYGEANVRVNAILPGWVVTPRQLDKWLTPEAEAEWRNHVALKERLMPSEVAKLALFLASSDSKMITGQSFVIDAGRT
jgi:NAD(P)-dependent dehydrogenase (short-subunit alcohol dehydrogenase family)